MESLSELLQTPLLWIAVICYFFARLYQRRFERSQTLVTQLQYRKKLGWSAAAMIVMVLLLYGRYR